MMHICMYRVFFLKYRFIVSLSPSLTYFVCPILCGFYCYPAEPVMICLASTYLPFHGITTSTIAKKLQLRQELSNVRQRDISVADYTSPIKDICNSLASINMTVEEDEMVQVCIGGLASKFGSFRTALCTRESTSSFFELRSMLLVEKNHTSVSTSMHTDYKMVYPEAHRSRV